MNLMQALLNQENGSFYRSNILVKIHKQLANPQNSGSGLCYWKKIFLLLLFLDLEVYFQKAGISLRVMVKTVAIVPAGIVMELYGRGAHGKRE